MKKCKISLVSLFFVISLLTLNVQAITWNMPTPYPDVAFQTININAFAKAIETDTDGGLTIRVHPSGSLFKHPEINKAVRSNQVPIGEFFLSLLSNENTAFGLDSLPFFATTYDQAWTLWQVQKPIIEKLLAQQNMMVLFSVPWPPQGLYTNKLIENIDDLKGLRFRISNAILEKFVNLIDAAPTQIEGSDIAQAFSTGRVDAMITSATYGANLRAWDFLTHYNAVHAWIPKNIVVVNKDAFSRLTKTTQTIMLKRAEEAEIRGWQMSKTEDQPAIKMLRENGIIVNYPSTTLNAELAKIGKKFLSNWLEQANNESKSILNAYQLK